MGRHGLPIETKNKIKQIISSGGTIRGAARELKLSRTSVERVLFPDRVRRREKKKKYSRRLIRLDERELPPDNFNVYSVRFDWLTG